MTFLLLEGPKSAISLELWAWRLASAQAASGLERLERRIAGNSLPLDGGGNRWVSQRARRSAARHYRRHNRY